jgi:hypothetical protein
MLSRMLVSGKIIKLHLHREIQLWLKGEFCNRGIEPCSFTNRVSLCSSCILFLGVTFGSLVQSCNQGVLGLFNSGD